MKHNDFPTGTARHIEGHVDLNDPDTFGFLRVKVTTPKDLYIPLLQVKHEGRTIAPLGTWTDWYFTEELKLATTLGYTFEVLEAVLFERGKVFSKYVSTLYDLRKTYSSEDPRNMICKLLLWQSPSLYGRFGMNPEMTEWTLYNTETHSKKAVDILSKTKGAEVFDLDDCMLVGVPIYKNRVVEPSPTLSAKDAYTVIAKEYNISLELIDNLLPGQESDTSALKRFNKLTSEAKHNYLNISLPIAMAVTSYARMRIYEFKAYAGKENLLYSDTDSIFTTVPLPLHMVNSELGAMKLEYIACNAIFLAPSSVN